jgi:hypothetical protein
MLEVTVRDDNYFYSIDSSIPQLGRDTLYLSTIAEITSGERAF